LKAKANSRNPKRLLPYLTIRLIYEFNHPGNIAKGKANANENRTSHDGCTPLEAASTNKVPTIGPVQEKDTIASANAINKIPIIPPSAWLSTLFAQN
jgi:hypothetical protein